jgi:hypothetical protein
MAIKEGLLVTWPLQKRAEEKVREGSWKSISCLYGCKHPSKGRDAYQKGQIDWLLARSRNWSAKRRPRSRLSWASTERTVQTDTPGLPRMGGETLGQEASPEDPQIDTQAP